MTEFCIDLPEQFAELFDNATESNDGEYKFEMTKEFIEWMDEEGAYSDPESAWGLSKSLIVWSPDDTLQTLLDDDYLEAEYGISSLTSLSRNEAILFLRENLYPFVDEAPSAHIYPIKTSTKTLYLLGLVQFYPGGIDALWLGCYKSIDCANTALLKSGFRSIHHELSDSELEDLLKRNKLE